MQNQAAAKFTHWLNIVIALSAILFTASGLAKGRADETSAAKAFEVAKNSRPELLNFLQEFPKGADLHNHLDGTVFSEHALESAEQKNFNYDLVSNSFTSNEVGDKVISLDELKSNSVYFRAFRESFSIRAWKQVPGSGRDQFFDVFDRIASSGISEGTMLRYATNRARLQNIQHLELMASVVPSDVQAKFDSALTSFSIDDLEQAYAQISHLINEPSVSNSIQQQISSWEADALLNQPQDTLSVRYIGYIIRVIGLRDFFIATASNLTAVNRDKRVVSLTLVVPEDLPAAVADFDNQMKIIDFLWQKMGQPNLSLHAGELNLDDATPTVLKDRIRKSIDLGHSKRIGHGVSIAWEENATGLLTQMAESKILVEICLTSNEAILGIKNDEHPFELYRKFNVPVSLNTDDEGVSRSTLTLEFVKAIERYDLSYADIIELARNSLEYSFLSGTSLYQNGDFTETIPAFKRHNFNSQNVSPEQQQLISDNPKLQAQLKFEQALVEFESTRANRKP